MKPIIYSLFIIFGGILYILEPLFITLILYKTITTTITTYYTKAFTITIGLPLLITISGTLTITDRKFIKQLGAISAIILAFINLLTTISIIGFTLTIIGATQKL
jgi:hypothetical protein